MDARTRKRLIEDFSEWSGGFPPESDREIEIYSTYARPCGMEAEEVRRVLKEWAMKEGMSRRAHRPYWD